MASFECGEFEGIRDNIGNNIGQGMPTIKFYIAEPTYREFSASMIIPAQMGCVCEWIFKKEKDRDEKYAKLIEQFGKAI